MILKMEVKYLPLINPEPVITWPLLTKIWQVISPAIYNADFF